MKTIFVIGKVEEIQARKILSVPDEIKIVIVDSMEDVPISERLSSITRSIYEIKAPPKIPEFHYQDIPKQNHKRPYKYHR
jgi:hypothetical protein